MTPFAAIADDLTGACDVAAELAAAGRRVRVVVEPGAAVGAADGAVEIVNTQSRALAPSAAAGRVRAALGARPALVLKKIDTALRGHLGAELDAALDHLGATGFVLAAIPEAGRVTRDGCQWFGGRLLAETEFADDPEGPGALSAISEVVRRESERRVVVIGRDVVRRGALASLVAERRSEGVDLFVLDAETDADVHAAVAAIVALPGPLCLAGSIALAAALAAQLPEPGSVPGAASTRVSLPAVIVNGSLHSRARAQVEAVTAAGLAVPLVVSESDRANAYARVASTAHEALLHGTSVVLAPAPAQATPADASLRATEAMLADATAALAARSPLGTLVLIGGETSHAVLMRLGAGALAIHGRVGPLIACGTVLHGIARGATLITKGGSGGEPGVVAELLAASVRRPRRAAEGT